MSNANPYEPGSRVVIRHNPHTPGAENIVGTVIAYHPRAGFGGCDLADVEYEDPRDGQVHVMPFGTANLSPGSPAALLEMAERYETLASELRQLAREVRA